MKINEIYKSIEGEGIFQGYLSVFIRLAGCNLDCSWCDTKYAFTDYKEISINEIINDIKLNYSNIKNIVITGGEPFLQQKEVCELINKLKDNNKRICIYTNGTIEIDKEIFNISTVIMDYKLEFKNEIDMYNIRNFKNGILKFVIKSGKQFKEMINVLEKIENSYIKRNNQIHITPAFNLIENKELAQLLINNNNDNIKLSLQQHKYIWNPEERGI